MSGHATLVGEDRPAGGSGTLERLILTIVGVLFFFPKIDLFNVPGFTIQAKPEDVIWIASLIFVARSKLVARGSVRALWLLLLAYVGISIFIHISNTVLLVRLFFYSLPLIFVLELSDRFMVRLAGMIRTFLLLMAIIAVLQVATPFPHLHTGVFGLGPIDRAPGIYGNGVEFALMSLFAYWLLLISGERRLWPWLAAIVIAYCSGTRLVLVALLVSGIVFVPRLPALWRIVGIGSAAFGMAALLALSDTDPESRFADIDPTAVVSAVMIVLDGVQGAQSPPSDQDGYCFEFDDSLADDQSFAMRLSKLLFVTEYVVLGTNPLGFGAGNCIGDAGDNLYVRTLSDGGIPFLVLVLLFFASLMLRQASQKTGNLVWRSFVLLLMGVSLFYDTLYFSRVAPLIMLCIAVELSLKFRQMIPTPRGVSS